MQPEQLQLGWNALVQLEDLALPELPEAPSALGQSQVNQAQAEADSLPKFVTAEETATSDLELAIQHCSEREAVFRRTALERFVFEHRLGQTSFDRLQQDIESSPELVQIDENRVTTQAAIWLELETIRIMREGKGRVEAIASLSQIEQQLSGSLTAEQRQAIAQVMTAPDAVMAWQGSAGVGKTYALNEVRGIAQSQCFQVQGFAPSAEAAHHFGRSASNQSGYCCRTVGFAVASA